MNELTKVLDRARTAADRVEYGYWLAQWIDEIETAARADGVTLPPKDDAIKDVTCEMSEWGGRTIHYRIAHGGLWDIRKLYLFGEEVRVIQQLVRDGKL